jgi:DNA gyrase subunit A
MNHSKDYNNHNKQKELAKRVVTRPISEEMSQSYLDYAMSVIVSRALPDVRDGLKPVQRRILYVMHEDGLTHSARFKKSATIVGDTLSKYHPHGDMAVYDAMARMAQDFSLRYPLIDGQGNWGSIDGDSQAAYRYTEARLTALAGETLKDIDKETVDFLPNYDGRLKEPSVLPSLVPQLLLNGTFGIAVGMATNIPPHNLSEVVDALVYLADKPKADISELMTFIKGPDFPTGGFVFDKKDIKEAYLTGKGGVVTRGEAEIVEQKEGQYQIRISSIPYAVNKADLISKMAELVSSKKVDGVRDIRDESDKEGLSVVVDLKAGVNPQRILNSFYKHTDLEKIYYFNMVALADGIQPQLFSLKTILEQFLNHRRKVVERRTRFDLNLARNRLHILEGLKKALDQIDAVIKTIKRSADRKTAHDRLMKKFGLSDKQATAILEMRLQTLASLERQKIEDELKEKVKLVKKLTALLKDPKKILKVVKDELVLLKEKYGDERRTKIVARPAKNILIQDLIPEEAAVLVLTKGGYIKRSKPELYRVQKRGGKGVVDISTKEEDSVYIFLQASTHDDLLFFTNKGKVYKLKMYEIPEAKRATRGKSIVNFLPLSTGEYVSSVLAVPKELYSQRQGFKKEKSFLVMITRKGIAKKVAASQFESVRRNGLISIHLRDDDELRWTRIVSPKDHLILVTKSGQAIRFKESDIRATGRTAAGVKAIALKREDELVGADVVSSSIEKNSWLLTLSEKGFGKKTKLNRYRLQKRGGLGIKTAKITAKTGDLAVAKVLTAEMTEAIIMSKKGQVLRTKLADISETSRQAQGVRIMKLKTGDKLASLTCF